MISIQSQDQRLIDLQLLTELRAAAKKGMVKTRSQQSGEGVGDMSTQSPSTLTSRKRKIKEVSGSQNPTPKRSHMLLRSQTPERNTPVASHASHQLPDTKTLETPKEATMDLRDTSGKPERRQALEMITGASTRLSESPTKADSLPSTEATVQGETSPSSEWQGNRKQREGIKNMEEDVSAELLRVRPRNAYQPIQPEARKHSKKTNKRAATDASKGTNKSFSRKLEDQAADVDDTMSKPLTLNPSTHKRFDSEEPNPTDLAPLLSEIRDTRPQAAAVEDDTSDSDAAPETITKSTILNHAHSTAAEISRAISQQSIADRRKRRKRDELLKLQAQASTKRAAKRKRGSSSPEPSSHSPRLSANNPVPDLLPDWVLRSTPGERLPTPPPAVVPPKPNKLRFLDREERPPKDVRKGDVVMRVLESKGKQNLPPKVNKASRNLREAWLSGKRKGVRMERKSWKGGFVRR